MVSLIFFCENNGPLICASFVAACLGIFIHNLINVYTAYDAVDYKQHQTYKLGLSPFE